MRELLLINTFSTKYPHLVSTLSPLMCNAVPNRDPPRIQHGFSLYDTEASSCSRTFERIHLPF